MLRHASSILRELVVGAVNSTREKVEEAERADNEPKAETETYSNIGTACTNFEERRDTTSIVVEVVVQLNGSLETRDERLIVKSEAATI